MSDERLCFYCHETKPNSAERLHICKSCADDMWLWDELTFRCDACRVDYHKEKYMAKIGGDNDAMFCTDCFWSAV